MRHFPLKTLLLCVLLPPFVYVFCLQQLEKTLQARYDRALSATYTGDTRQLFDGSVALQDAIRNNVDHFLAGLRLADWGVRVTVTVKTSDGVYLYPDAYDGLRSDIGGTDSIATARENFRLLSEGLVRTLEVKIEHNTAMANAILMACVLTALSVLSLMYRRGLRLLRAEEADRQAALARLENERAESLTQLTHLESDRTALSEKIDRMREALDNERRKASATEDEMMDELVSLEEKLSENLAHQDQQLQEIEALKEKLSAFENAFEADDRQAVKGQEAVRKRFDALYKNIAIHERAVAGFFALPETLKIKAEEVIHQLNDDPKQVQIKRKVFGKKNRETVFEVIFAYKGRLYFRNIAGGRVEVLVVGTKLTQNKDLSFLDKL